MKKFNYAIMLAINILVLSAAVAQKDSSGIYKTAEDFQTRKLSYAINYKTEKHKIKDNILFKDEKIIVKHKGETYTLLKHNTYGYRNTKGVEFRFIDNKAYKVLNPGQSLLIYFYQHTAHTGKDINRGLYQPEYYFSKDATSPLQDLTLTNVKTSFPENHKLHDALDAQFKSDKELYSYDSFHKMYKLNWVISNILPGTYNK